MSSDGSTTSEAAFSALGNDIRIKILRTLSEELEDDVRHLSFSEIYGRLPIDSTSQLSYHLDSLTGIFVHHSESGYALTQAGERVVRAIRSGTYSDQPSFDSTEIEGHCPHCDGRVLTATYPEPFLVIECKRCSERVVTFNLPPAESRNRTSREILDSCNRRVHREYVTALRGTCPTCGGVTDREIETSDPSDTHRCAATCRECQLRLFAPVEVPVLHHPAVVSLYWQHEIDTTAVPFWDLPSYVGEWEITVRETTPTTFHVTVVYEGSTIQLKVDDQAAVSRTPDDPAVGSD